MKKSIKTILAGLLVVPVLALGVSLITPMTQSVSAEVTGGIQGGADAAKGDGQQENLFGDGGIFKTIVNIALYIIGAISVMMLIYGGIRYTVSAGDSKAVTDAKNTIMYAIIGVVIAILAYAIVNFVLESLIAG